MLISVQIKIATRDFLNQVNSDTSQYSRSHNSSYLGSSEGSDPVEYPMEFTVAPFLDPAM